MSATVFIPIAAVGQVGVVVLLAASLLAAILGIIAFAWAMVLLWRENNPQGIVMRGDAAQFEDPDETDEDVSWTRNATQKLRGLVSR